MGETTEPRILAWGRPDVPAALSCCAIESFDHGGSVTTMCRGRWSNAEPMTFYPGEKPALPRNERACGGCVRELAIARVLHRLRDVELPGESPRYSLEQFDIGGES